MNNFVNTEKSLKRWLKTKVKVTLATVVGFLIAGTVVMGAGIVPKDGVYTNDVLLNTLKSTKFAVGQNGNLEIYSNGSVGNLLSDLKDNHSLGGIQSALSQHENYGKDYVVLTGALAGQGKYNTGIDSLVSIAGGTNELSKKVAEIINRTNTKKDNELIEQNLTTTIGNKTSSPVVLGLIGGDMIVGTGKFNIFSMKEEPISINRKGDTTVTLNNGNVFGTTTGSTAVSLGNIAAKKGITLNLQGETTANITGNTALNINNGANGAGLTAGGLAAAIGGTSTSTVNGTSTINVNSKVSSEQLEGITVGLFGGGMAVSTLGGTASANTTGDTNITINNGVSAVLSGSGLAVSTDASQYLKDGLEISGKKGTVDENGNFHIDLDGIPELIVSGLKEGGTSTVTSGNTNITLTGRTSATGVIGSGFAISHQNAPQGSTAEGAQNKISSSTVTAGDTHITVNVDDSNLTKDNIKQIIDALNSEEETLIKKLQNITGTVADKGIVVGLGGNGVAAARDKGVSNVTAGNTVIDLKDGYIVGVIGNGIASGNASSTVKADSSVVNIDGAEVIGVSGSGIALDHGVVKDTAYSKSEIGNTTVNLNSGSADGIFGGGIAVTKDHADSKAETITSGKSIININGGTVDKFGYQSISGIFGTRGSFNKVAEAGKDVAITAGGVASRNGVTRVAESEININGGTVKGDIIAGGIAVAGGISEVGKSTINITGGDIQGSIYGTGIAIADDNTVGKVDKTQTSAKVENSILNINGYKNSIEKIAGFNEIYIGEGTELIIAKLKDKDGKFVENGVTAGIEVKDGSFENAGIITFDSTDREESATLISLSGTGTVTNKGTITLSKKESNDFVIDNTNGTAKNIGMIKIADMTVEEIEKETTEDKVNEWLFKGEVSHTGLVLDKDGKTVFLDKETTVEEDTTTEILDKLAQGDGSVGVNITEDNTDGKITITGTGDNKVDSEVFNVTGGTAAIEGTVIIDSDKVNLADNGQFEVGKDSTLALENGLLAKEDEGEAIKVTDGGTLALDNMDIKGDITGEGTATVKVDGTNNLDGNFTGLTFDFGANTRRIMRTLSIPEKTKVVSFEADNVLNDSKFLFNGNKEAQVILKTKLNEKSELQNAFGNSTGVVMEGSSSTEVNNGDLLIKTGDISGDVVIKLGDNTFTNVGVITDSEIYKVDKVLNETADGTETVLKAEYNNDLFADTPELNEVNKAAKVVNTLFSQDTIERKAQLDKFYSSNIYSETVRAAYDNIKMNEEAVESLARKSEVGKWTAEGKALYAKNEYDRKGIVGDYSSEVESTGLMAAFGYGVNETTTAGVAFSGVKQDVDTDNGSADADLFYLGVYGNKVVGNYDFIAGLGYQFGEYDADNNILGTTGDKYDTQALSGYVQGRYTADLGDGLSIQPKVKLGYTYIDQDNAKDSYFGVSDAEISTFDAEVGFDVVKSVQFEKSQADVKFGVSYIKAMGDTDKEFEGRFYGKGTSDKFDVLGAELAENTVKFNLGAEAVNENGFFYNGGFTYEFGSDDTEAYGVNVGVGYKF